MVNSEVKKHAIARKKTNLPTVTQNENNLTTATWNEVKQNVLSWNNIRTNPSIIKPFFNGETFFEFHPSTSILHPKTALHFYPAITPTGFVLYIIKAINDKFTVFEQDPVNFPANYIITAEIKMASPDEYGELLSKIPRKEALERIANWDEHHDQWIDCKAPNGGLFQAFTLSANDHGLQDQLTGFFGLVGTADPFSFSADIILENNRARAFFNTVKPVPPYPPETPQDFFILEAATSPGV